MTSHRPHSFFSRYQSSTRHDASHAATPEVLNALIDTISDPAYRADVRARFAASVIPQELSAGERIALLTLRRSEVSKAVLSKLKASTARANGRDYWRLIQAGLAVRHGERGFLLLTPRGRRLADQVAQACARDLGLHFFTTGYDRLHHFIRCTCGWAHNYTAPLHHVAACNAEWQGRHIFDVMRADGDDAIDDATVYGEHEEHEL